MDIDAAETEIVKEVEEINEIEMVDAEIDNIIRQGLSDSRWAKPLQVTETAASQRQVKPSAVIATVIPKTKERATGSTEVVEVIEQTTISQEFATLIEAEKSLAANIAEKFELCSTAVIAIEDSLSSKLSGPKKQCVESLRVYLRASIAQFLHVGSGTVPPILPAAPSLLQPNVILANHAQEPSTNILRVDQN
ncbi:putative eka-like protein [Golovinomyces cichoracearum]|uniref:Putative eka-like protein n=1 Tax=Golovinomyces cichoracearum TaxID=62708 RepID=A0A420ID07_9PEZI|nr:putative eka-like protein [Golovinomyces cichoracearum]